MNSFLLPKRDLCKLMTNDKFQGGVTYVQKRFTQKRTFPLNLKI